MRPATSVSGLPSVRDIPPDFTSVLDPAGGGWENQEGRRPRPGRMRRVVGAGRNPLVA